MIIACPRCEASYAVDAAEFGPRNRVVRCSACDFRWSQRPHEAGDGNAGEGSSSASPNADVADASDRLQPIREAEPMGPEAPVSESATHRRRRGAERAGSGRRCRHRRRWRGFAPGRSGPVLSPRATESTPCARRGRRRSGRNREATPPSSRISASGGPWSPAWPPSGRSSPSPLFSFCCASRSSRFCRTRPGSTG
ncbi:MAG: MJ0042-type zinc finger domain-containing protein [Bacteroidota bacterium]